MSQWAVVGVVAASLFAVFTGFNDAGTLVSIGIRVRGIRPLTALMVLTAAVLAAPLILGTAVAGTLDHRLVGFDGSSARTGHTLLIVGVAAAVAVTVLLALQGLPTSLTLALIGGITGAGVGARLADQSTRLAVDWQVVGSVLAAAAVAPVVGALAALATGKLLTALPPASSVADRLRWMHLGAFSATCLAYGANDGQKIVAVYAALLGGSPEQCAASPTVLVLIAFGFAAGGLLGMRKISSSVAGGLTAARPDAVVVTELSGAGVVLGTAAIGAPVSMTQSLSGALVGTGLSQGSRRVRWRSVLRLGRAWLVTLPAAFMAAACCAVLSTAF